MIFLSLNSVVFAEGYTDLANTYEEAKLPNFLPLVGKGLAGRCYIATSSNKKIASILMVSFEEDGFEIAPFDAEKKRPDFFDKLIYEDVLNKFPMIKKMFLDVNETADGAIAYKEQGADEYRYEIRESDKYLIMRVYLNDKIIKNCNYYKRD